MNCRTVADAIAAASLRDDPPLTQEQADLAAALIGAFDRAPAVAS